MVKVCIVKSCPNGGKWRNRKNEPPPYYFQAKTPERLQKWKMSLGMELKASSNVCHLHFKEEHLNMYEKFYVQGELIILVKDRKSAKDDSLPTIEHQFIPIPGHRLTNIVPKSEQPNLNCNHTKSEQQYQPEKIVDQEVFNKIIIPNLKTEHKWHNVQFEQTAAWPEKEKNAEHDLTDPLSLHAHNDSNNHKETKSSTQLERFKDNIDEIPWLPPLWLYVNKPNGFEFMRMDPTTGLIKNHLRLNDDASITVILRNKEELHLQKKINSMKDISNHLKSIQKWPVCVGTQIDDNKYSTECTGVIIGEGSNNRNQPNPRCRSCRLLRARLESPLQICDSISNDLEKIEARKRQAAHIARKCKRLKRSNIRLKQKLLIARAACAKKSGAVQKTIDDDDNDGVLVVSGNGDMFILPPSVRT